MPGETLLTTSARWIKPRTAKWQAERERKLRRIARVDPRVVFDAREIGRIRREWEPYRQPGLVMKTAVKLRAYGLSWNEIGHTMFLPDRHVVALAKRWRERTT